MENYSVMHDHVTCEEEEEEEKKKKKKKKKKWRRNLLRI